MLVYFLITSLGRSLDSQPSINAEDIASLPKFLDSNMRLCLEFPNIDLCPPRLSTCWYRSVFCLRWNLAVCWCRRVRFSDGISLRSTSPNLLSKKLIMKKRIPDILKLLLSEYRQNRRLISCSLTFRLWIYHLSYLIFEWWNRPILLQLLLDIFRLLKNRDLENSINLCC